MGFSGLSLSSHVMLNVECPVGAQRAGRGCLKQQLKDNWETLGHEGVQATKTKSQKSLFLKSEMECTLGAPGSAVSAVCNAGLSKRHNPGLCCASVVRITCPASPLLTELRWCLEQSSSLAQEKLYMPKIEEANPLCFIPESWNVLG